MKNGNSKKEAIIKDEFNNLLERLNKLEKRNKIDSEIKIILIKVSVYNALCVLLKERGYNALNNAKIDFPKYYNDKDVIKTVRDLLEIK